jgi:hypothetical protein
MDKIEPNASSSEEEVASESEEMEERSEAEATGSTSEDPTEASEYNEPFDKDLPCIRCGYNLRGLKPDGNCPECGAPIRKSLNFAMERVLCLACMCPVHPSVTKCPNCGAPMNATAAMANYWQITPRGVARKKPEEKRNCTARNKSELPKLPPPPPSPKTAWMICSPLAGIVLVWAMIALGPEQPAGMVASSVIALLILVPAIRATRTYKRRWNECQRQIAALLKDKGSSGE